MLLGIWVLTALIHLSTTAVVPHRRHHATDAFLSGKSEGLLLQSNINSNEVTTILAPKNSNEVTHVQQQQQNSVEITAQEQQQQNSVEGPTTFNPFNSNEVTAKPQKTSSPPAPTAQNVEAASSTAEATAPVETVSNTDTTSQVGSSSNTDATAPVTNEGVNSASSGASSVAGTQPFFPQVTSTTNQKGNETTEIESGGNANIASAAGTQPFFPQVASTTNQKGNENTETESGGNTNIASAAGTQPFLPQVTSTTNQKGNTNTETESGGNANIASAAGTQPFFPQVASNTNQKVNGDTQVKSESNVNVASTVGIQPSLPQTNNANTKAETVISPVIPESTSNAGIGAGAHPFSPNSNNPTNEQESGGQLRDSQINANTNRVAGLQPIEVLNGNPESNSLRRPGVEPIAFVNTQETSVPNSLRDALNQVGVDDTDSHPLVEEAKQYFISIWNLEAHRLNAPYLEVTDVWPEVGMVYMPTINQMSSRIQNSRPVKEAAERLKATWAEHNPSPDITLADKNYISSMLSEFLNFLGFGKIGSESEYLPRDDLVETPYRKKQPSNQNKVQGLQQVNNAANQRPVASTNPAVHRPVRPAIRIDPYDTSSDESRDFSLEFSYS